MAERLTHNLPILLACVAAVSCLAALPDTCPPNPPPRKIKPAAYAVFAAGTSQSNSGDWQGAAKSFRKVIELDPEAVLPRVKLGIVLARLGKSDEAIGVIKKAVELDPTSVPARMALGPMLIKNMQQEEGLAQWEAALPHASDEQKKRLLGGLSRACEVTGHLDRAIDYTNRLLEIEPDSVPLLLRLAKLCTTKGDREGAVKALEALAGLHPDSLRMWLQLAGHQVRAGQFDGAVKSYEKCLELAVLSRNRLRICFAVIAAMQKAGKTNLADPYRARARTIISDALGTLASRKDFERISDLLGGGKELQLAVDLFRKAVEKAAPAEAPGLHYSLAGLLMFAGQPVDAIDHVRRAIELRAGEARYHSLLGLLFARTKNFDEAHKAFNKAIKLAPGDGGVPFRIALASMLEREKKRPQAIEELNKAIAIKPECVEGRFLIASLLQRDKQYAAAAEHVEAVVPLLDDDPAMKLRARHTLAQLYRLLKRYDDAAAQFREAIELDPAEIAGYVRLAWLLCDQGKHDQAITVIDDGLKNIHEEDRIRCRLAKSRLLERVGEDGRAEAILREIIKDDPANGEAHYSLAGFLDRAGRYEQAVTSAKQAIALTVDGDELLGRRLLLAGIYDDMGNDEECERLLKSEYLNRPDSPMVNNHLGYYYAEKGENLDEAVKLIKKALKAEPDSAAYLDSLGWAYYKQGKYEDAANWLERAAELLPDAVITDHLGDVLDALGRTEEARNKWRSALEQDPSEKLAREIRKKIENPPPLPKKNTE